MGEETLGTEFSTTKIRYLLFLLGVYFLYFFFYIGFSSGLGANPGYAVQKDRLFFYIWFGLVLGVLPLILDLIFRKNIDLPLDTISYENNAIIPVFNNFWFQAAFGVLFSAMIMLRVSISGQAFVKAPQFALTIPGFASIGLTDKVVGAFLSGLTAGIVESIIFFGFILPVIYAFLKNQDIDDIVAMIITVVLSAIVFTGYHWFVYGYILASLVAVFIFGIMQAIFTVIFRSQTVNFITHFTNNFAVSLFVASAYLVQVIF